MTEDEKFMKKAIAQAMKAEAIGEVPIGCVIVYEGKIIARDYNKRKKEKNTLAHAEIAAIRKACKKMGDWRLEGCTMYVTLEPCPMCAGAIVQARMDRVVMGTTNAKAGCAGSVLNILQEKGFNHQVELTKDILHDECSDMLKSFFKSLRKRVKEERKLEKQEAEKSEADKLEAEKVQAQKTEAEETEKPEAEEIEAEKTVSEGAGELGEEKHVSC